MLVPVELGRKSARHDFEITLFDEAPRFNATLSEMLRRDFAIDVADFDDEFTGENGNIDITLIRDSLSRAAQHLPDFQVRSSIMLDTLSFGKYLMWKDLVDRTDELRQNRVVRHILDTPMSPYREQAASPEARELDSKTSPAELFTPLSADSSQLAAVVATERGNDFMMIGPPGTGKSQTIANMVAHNLAKGKTVLFVSEKAAALEVVYRRLQNIGLGDFCLELHSNKAKRLEVLQQLGRAWDAATETQGVEDEWLRTTGRLQTLRDDLNQYAARLHEPHRNGFTVHRALSEVVNGTDIPPVQLSWPSLDVHGRDDFERLAEAGRRLGINAGAVGDITNSPLVVVSNDDWSPGWEQSLVDAAQSVSDATRRITTTGGWLEQLDLSPELMPRSQLEALRTLGGALRTAHDQLARDVALPQSAEVISIVSGGDWSLEWAQSLVNAAQGLDGLAQQFATAKEQGVAQGLSVAALPVEQMQNLSDDLGVLAKVLCTTRAKQLDFAFLPNAAEVMTAARAGAEMVEQHGQKFAQLSISYDRDALIRFDHATPS